MSFSGVMRRAGGVSALGRLFLKNCGPSAPSFGSHSFSTSAKEELKKGPEFEVQDGDKQTPLEFLSWVPAGSGEFVTTCDASPDQSGKTGGGVGWVTRNDVGDVQEKGYDYVHGVTDTTALELHAVIDFATKGTNVKGIHYVCLDNLPAVKYLCWRSVKTPVRNQTYEQLADKAIESFRNNFPAESSIRFRWLPRNLNYAADSLSHFGKAIRLDKVTIAKERGTAQPG